MKSDNLSKSARNKQLKKERKLLIIFVKKFLKVENEYNFNISESRHLLIDNRDYQIFVSTKFLYSKYKDYIADIYVIPTKTWFVISFPDSLACQKFIENESLQTETGIHQYASIDDSLLMEIKNIFHDESLKTIQQFKHGSIKGLRLHENILTDSEYSSLMSNISKLFVENEDTAKLCKLKNRQAIHFGYVFDYNENTISSSSKIEIVDKSFPEDIQNLLKNNTILKNILPEMPDQLTINRYSLLDGDHIPPHVDTHSMCTDWILSISLGSDVVMNFTNPRGDSETNIRSVHLKSGSALLLREESRYLYRHSISKTCQDLIVYNDKLALSPRGLRFSLTFRKITPSGHRCQCLFPETCDSQMAANIPENASESLTDSVKALKIENEYVHQIYDDIATHFSSTRYGCWAKVVDFLNDLKPGSLVVDVGCGNGKYLSANRNIVMLGSDRSMNLLTICKERNFEVFQDDCIQISKTLRPNICDAVICIAVIHHLATEQRRIEAIESIINMLTVGGLALVTVWAFEQKRDSVASKYLKKNAQSSGFGPGKANNELPVHTNRTEFQKQDVFVPWTKAKKPEENGETSKDVKLRFYHVFKEGELENMIEKVAKAKIIKIYYDQGNWCAIFKKIN